MAVAGVAGAVALADGTRDDVRPGDRPSISRFGDAPVVKGARGGTFDDPVVRKGAGGAPIP